MYAKLLFSAVVLVGGIASAPGQNAIGPDQRVLANAQRVTGDRFTISIRTQKGANVYAVNRPSATVLKAIDTGLTDLFAVAKKNRYRNRLNYSDYSVFIGLADRTLDSTGQYSPDIAIGAAQYAGSIYDQGGYIYAAGMVIANDPCSFVIAEHTRNFERIANVVRYEGEHLVLYHNDRRRYAATADHSKGGSHPILQ
ncbi:MAG: hypothetical protein ABIO36_03640 [Pyrinomonadaceae bacterium]